MVWLKPRRKAYAWYIFKRFALFPRRMTYRKHDCDVWVWLGFYYKRGYYYTSNSGWAETYTTSINRDDLGPEGEYDGKYCYDD